MPEHDFCGLIGRTAVMQELFRQIRLLAPLDVTVLVEGEPGAGKEGVVLALHRMSGRAASPLVSLKADEISPALFASELFGHAADAFAGALGEKEGAAVAADGGTLVIDEVTELEAASQEQLARFIESGEVLPVGGGEPRQVDVRLLCTATRRPGEGGSVRRLVQEVFLHLQVFTLRVPPLRERLDDLPLLAQHFLRRASLHYAKETAGLSPAAQELLARHRWEGNVRQLAEEMERAVVLTPAGNPVEPEVFSRRLLEAEGVGDG